MSVSLSDFGIWFEHHLHSPTVCRARSYSPVSCPPPHSGFVISICSAIMITSKKVCLDKPQKDEEDKDTVIRGVGIVQREDVNVDDLALARSNDRSVQSSRDFTKIKQ